MASSPSFASIPYNSAVTVSTANTTRDGSGTLVVLATAPTGGLVIHDIRMNAIATTTAGMLRFFLSDGSLTHHLIMEHPVSAVTPSATAPAWQSMFTDLNLVLQSGWQLKVSTEVANTFKISIIRAGAL